MPRKILDSLRSPTRVEQTCEQLLVYIDQEGLGAGDSLPSIAALADRFSASRAVIREVLKSLEARGIIEVTNGRCSKIRPVTSEPLLNYFQRCLQVDNRAAWEFMEVRAALEAQTVSLAVKRATDAQLVALESIVGQMRENLHNADAFAELDVQFHLLIARASHNTLMVHLLESLRDAIRESVRKGLHKRLTLEQKETVQRFHERLVETLLQRDLNGALDAIHAHFDEIAMSLD